MVTPLFVAAADLHSDEHGPWKQRGITGDAAFGLTQVVDYCLDHGPEFMILLGDLMHRPLPRQSAVRVLADQIDRLRDGMIRTYYVLGDHDGRQDWPELTGWARRVDGRLFGVGPFTGYGLDFLPRGRLQSALTSIPPEARILFTHQKWEEFVHESGQARLTEVPAQVRYVVTGDFHRPIWGEFGADQQVWSPGSVIATSVVDDGPRHFLVGRERDGKLSCEFAPLRSRPIHRLRASTADDVERIIAVQFDLILAAVDPGLPPEIARPIVDVEYFADIPKAYARLATIADRCFLFPRPRDRDRQQRREVRPLGSVLTPRQAVARLTRPGTPGHDWTVRLHDAADLRMEWEAIVAEQTGVSHGTQEENV